MLPLLLVGTSLLGCGRCEPSAWEDVDVAFDGDVDDADADAVEQALAQFQAWSGRDGACVRSIEVHHDAPVSTDGQMAAAGAFHRRSQRVEVFTQYGDPPTSTRHELCHAVDLQDGISQGDPELFPPDTSLDAYGRKNTRTQRAEGFALLCELGALDLDRWRTLVEQCDVTPSTLDQVAASPAALDDSDVDAGTLDLDAMQRVQEAVYAAAPRIPWRSPNLELQIQSPWTQQSDDGWSLRQVVASADHLVEPWSRAGSPIDFVRVDHLDPVTGELAGRQLVGCADGEPDCSLFLLPGSEAAWLIEPDTEGAQLWRLAPGTKTELPLSFLGSGDRIIGDVLWDLRASSVGPYELWGCDLTTAECVGRIDLPEGVVDAGRVELLEAAGRPALWWEGGGAGWLDEDGHTWHTHDLPAHLGITEVRQRPGAGDWLLNVVSEASDGEVGMLALYDPRDDRFTTLMAPCELHDSASVDYAGRLFGGTDWVLRWEELQSDDCRRVFGFTPFGL